MDRSVGGQRTAKATAGQRGEPCGTLPTPLRSTLTPFRSFVEVIYNPAKREKCDLAVKV